MLFEKKTQFLPQTQQPESSSGTQMLILPLQIDNVKLCEMQNKTK